jgi:predicted MFS family arabinose efflux permease
MGSERLTRLMVPSLTLAVFATQPCETILSLLLIDIAETFKAEIGVMGQIRTTSGLLTLVTALIIGVLSMRINHKTLLVTGLGFFVASGIGCSLAQDYTTMLAAYSLSGIGLAMVGPMSLALVGEHVPLDRRANAVGYITAGGASSFLVGGPIMNYVTRFGGWRSAFLLYMLPVAVIGLALTWLAIPSKISTSEETDTGSYLDGIRQVVTNRSALACLLGALLSKATWQGVISYGISYYREWYQIPKGWASLILSGLALGFIVSALLGGRLVNRFGRKPITFFSFLMVGVLSILYMNAPFYWLSMAIFLTMGVMSGVRRNASQSLALEQVPAYRGSMMALSTASNNLGSILGAGIGGAVLLTSDYPIIGVVLGILGVLSALVIKLFASDPTEEGEFTETRLRDRLTIPRG